MARSLIGSARTATGTRTPVFRSGILNSTFENAPPFTAATTTGQRWIDGTAAGSTTNNNYGWATQFAGSCSAQLDSSTSNSGSSSIKVSTVATGASSGADIMPSNSAANVTKYGIPIFSNTKYIVAGYMKTSFISGDSSDGAFIKIIERSSAGSALVVSNTTKIKTTTGFTFYSKAFTTGASSTYLDIDLVVVGNTGTATLIMDAWFDDLFLTAGVGRSLV